MKETARSRVAGPARQGAERRAELKVGKGARFESVEALMADLYADD